ncbi:MAG TPA: hypothetical protein VGY56_16100 [Verrucomicrobiae bacterium]|nr:hypothetical protein [Verrucomicrobiae bacterium]
MDFKKYYLFVPLILSVTSAATASSFSGVLSVQEDSSQTGAYTVSSLMLDNLNYTEPLIVPTGMWAATVPEATEVYAYSSTITGLTSTPQTVSISDFLVIGGPGPAPFDSLGTTPNNRFDFNLQTLEESSSQPGGFIGEGTLVDTQGVYANTPAELAINFTPSSANYSFTLTAVPEPATFSLLVGLGFLPFLRRKS